MIFKKEHVSLRILKELKCEISSRAKFVSSLKLGSVPENRKVGSVTLIFKKRFKDVAGNYRSIGL